MKERIVYKGRVINLSVRDLPLPDGGRSAVEVIGHPGAVLVAPFLLDGSLMMVRQYRPVIGRYIYEFPAGTRRRGEPYLKCAARELREETGLSSRRFARVGEIYPVPGYSTEKIVIYRADRAVRGQCRRERDEFMENVQMKKKEAADLFRAGGMIDAKTICALAFLGII